MTVATHTSADVGLREIVSRQLAWDPEVDSSAIGVTAVDGAVTLTGFIDTYAGKLAAERAAKHVRGVRAVANDIEVRLKYERTDDDLAADAARALKLHGTIPETVQAVVHDGRITLTGHVQWMYERTAAVMAMRDIKGVKEVINRIELIPTPIPRDVRHRITEALHRIADINARNVAITVKGSTATLTGAVTTWAQRDAAERAAAGAPGIEHVNNMLAVQPRQL